MKFRQPDKSLWWLVGLGLLAAAASMGVPQGGCGGVDSSPAPDGGQYEQYIEVDYGADRPEDAGAVFKP